MTKLYIFFLRRTFLFIKYKNFTKSEECFCEKKLAIYTEMVFIKMCFRNKETKLKLGYICDHSEFDRDMCNLD